MNPHLSPVAPSERINAIDILRGFAIFGILVVNTFYFFNPWYAPQITEASSGADEAAHFLINFLFVSKFYTLFSFLFGLGMFIQMSRAEVRGRPFVPLYLRRLLILALFGLAHAVLLWIGDILFIYALTGLLLLLFFRNRQPRTLLIWAVILIAVPVLFIGASVGLIEFARTAPVESGIWQGIEAQFAETARQMQLETARDYEIYGSGNFAAITAERWSDFTELMMLMSWFMMPSVLGMFLLGLRAGKRGWFTQLDEHKSTFRRLLLWALPLGLAMNFYVAITGFSQNQLGIEIFSWQTFFQLASLNIGSVLLSLSYVAGITLFSQSQAGQRLLSPLAPVGRMALSNYLMHSVVMTTLAYGYGFGLFGQVGLAAGLGLAVVLYAVQIPLSRWWLNRFNFGPFEWIWRTLTYTQIQPMRLKQRRVA
jgi:uncharacterized protein